MLVRLFFLFLFSISFTANAQKSVLDKKIDFHCSNLPIASALKQIEKQTGTNFIYVTGLFNSSKTATFSGKDVALKNVLQQLIQDLNIEFYASGKNIVITRKTESSHSKKTESEATTLQAERFIAYIAPPETIRVTVHDTVRLTLRDTVILTVYDTIQKIREIPVKSAISIGLIANYGFPFEKIKKGDASSKMYDNIKKSEKIKSTANIGIILNYQQKKWGFQSGLIYSVTKWNTDYNYTFSQIDTSKVIGYTETVTYEVNTIPSHFSNDRDKTETVKVITKMPIYQQNTENVIYNGINQTSYIKIPIQVSYFQPVLPKTTFHLTTGVGLNMLTSAKGQTQISENMKLVDLKTTVRDFYMCLNSSIGIHYNLHLKHILLFQAGFNFNISPVFRSNYPLIRNQFCPSVGVGYQYCF